MDVNYEIIEPLKKKKHKKKVPMQLKAKMQVILGEFMQSKEDEILRECMRSSKQILRKLMHSKKKEILRDFMHSKKKEILREFMHLQKKEILLQSKKKEIPKSKKKKKKEDEFPQELELLKDMNIADREELRNFFFPGNPMKPWDELILSQIFDDLDDLPLEQEYDPVRDVTKKLERFIYDQGHKANYRFKCDIKVGGFVDIESLLFSRPNDYLVSRDGRVVKAEDLSGKFVMVCCFFLPVCYSCSFTWTIAAVSYDLYSKLKGGFEMVIVAKMRRGWSRDKDAFLAFLDGFPPNCLAVPFRAKSHRHRVCKSLGGMKTAVTCMVDPNQTVLLHSHVPGGIRATSFVPFYGANSTPFPFVSKKVTYVSETCAITVPTKAMRNLSIPSSLEDFLCCKTSDIVSRKIPLGNGAFHQENVSISELKSKLVGLYLFTSGNMIPMLSKIPQACLQNGKELEIVLVYFPGINTAHDPQSAKQDFLNVLAKRNLPWWVAPYNSTASIMLDHMFECGERIVILGPNGVFVEPHGAELMQMFGFYAYPFSLDCVVQKISEELRQVTLGSFLKLLEIQEFPKMKKKVLFYFDYPFHIHHEVYAAVKGFSKCNDVRIIMVSLSDGEFSSEITTLQNSDSRDYSNSHKDGVVCYTKGSGKSDKFFLRFFNSSFPTIVAFGKDGMISSVLAHRLSSSDEDKAQIKGDLLEEVSSILNDDLEFYDKNETRFDRSQDHLQQGQELRQTKFW